MLRLGDEQPEVLVVSRSGRLPHLHPPPRRGARRADRERRVRHPPHGGRGQLLLVRVRPGDLRPGGRRVPRHVGDHRDARPPGAAAGLLGLGTERADPISCRTGARASPIPGRARGGAAGGARHEAPRRRRRRLHRLELRAPARLETHPEDAGARPRQAHLRRPAREPQGPARRPGRVGRRRHRRPRARSRAAVEGCDAIVNFAAESHVDRSIESPGEFIETDVFGTFVLLEAARDAGIRHLQVSTDEVYGSIEQGSFTEQSPLDPSSPVLGVEGGRRPDRRRLPPHLRRRRADRAAPPTTTGPRQHPEKLIPLCVLNALHGDPLPVYGDGMQVRNWLFVEDFCSRHRHRARLRRGRRGLQRRRARRAAQHRRRPADPRADRPRRVADRLRDRPAWPRPPLLARARSSPRRSAGSRRSASTRASSAPSTGTATTSGGGSRSAPANTASTTSASTGEARWADALSGFDTKLDGLVLIEPEVHGDERGFLVETFRDELAPARARHPSSSRRTTPARAPAASRPPLPAARGRRSWCAASRGRIWTSPSTYGATRPPTGSGRDTS